MSEQCFETIHVGEAFSDAEEESLISRIHNVGNVSSKRKLDNAEIIHPVDTLDFSTIELVVNYYSFGLTAVNAAVKTGRDQAEALAGAQAAGWGSQPGFGLSGTNANTNTFTQNVGGFDFSSANANANAFNQGFGQNGFGGSAANANAQSFESGGPLGSFGASAANSASQGFNVGPGGLSGSATFAGSQTYDLPGDREISISYSNGFGIGPDGRPTISRGNAISVS
ncbi:uncharacterized protein LOC128736340 [Sabethes cyaneus]|uniref:uncharacterized protein LOC128736340 n=1 Tax=Sabethes cyaneus TaxID=53552 RepID=UPI00237E58FB|nr:uncharacterized protein LOC128736340 [Sabethes cyaneus]